MSYLNDTEKLITFARAAKHSPTLLHLVQENLDAEIRFIQCAETSTECIVAAARDFGYVLAFRASKEFHDWAYTNTNAKLSPGPIGEMHTGYKKAFLSVLERIVAVLDDLQESKAVPENFYITGHSLGGALAVTGAVYASLLSGFPTVTAVHTYGQPRVFSRETAAEYDEMLGDRTYRFVTAGDGVTTMPPAIFGYGHTKQIQYFQPNGKLNLAPSAARMQKDRFLDYISEIINFEWWKFEDHSLELIERRVKFINQQEQKR